MSNAAPVVPTRRRGEPPWEIATIFPEQGAWDEGEYLALPTTRLVEFDNGMIEVLPVPKKYHQLIMLFLYEVFRAYIATRHVGGRVLTAGYKLWIRSRKYREPDIMYLTPEQDAGSNDDFANAAEWVVEVVSPDDPDRDYILKRNDYALARIPEYWIVDRDKQLILVLRFENDSYVEHGRFTSGQRATSIRFPDFSVSVDDVFNSCL